MFKIPGALCLDLHNSNCRGFSPRATQLSLCTAWEDGEHGNCSREQAPKTPQLGPLLALILRNQTPPWEQNKPPNT